MDIFKILEIFTMVTGMMYLVMQIMQDKYMWYVYIPSCAALATCMFHQKAWAFFALNVYFVIMGCVGAYRWRKQKSQVSSDKEGGRRINFHVVLNRLKNWEIWVALGILAIAIPTMGYVLGKTGDPHPWLDAISTSLCIIGTWWLTKSHIEQWYIWLFADIVTLTMQIKLGNRFLAAMYAFYILSCFVGYYNWRKNGSYSKEA